ncbi:MAG: hypothetical protein J6M02_01150 [Clostridia bacterium]|nr:hypothetical protein [Clostridia bacterium]
MNQLLCFAERNSFSNDMVKTVIRGGGTLLDKKNKEEIIKNREESSLKSEGL